MDAIGIKKRKVGIMEEVKANMIIRWKETDI